MPRSELIQSVTRAAEALELLTQAPEGLRLSEVAAGLGVGASTAHNLLRTLAARQLVEQQGHRYYPGPGLVVLAGRALRQQAQRGLASAVLSLSGRYPDATVTVAEAVGAEVRVRLRASPDRPGVLQQPSTTFSLYGSISALVVQAYADDDQLARLRRQYPFAEYGSHLWADEAALAARLREIRTAGHGLLPSPREGMLRAAVPVFAAHQLFVGTLGISLPAPAGGPASIIAALTAAARQAVAAPATGESTAC
jgi:DNA-binding IclR family transcriptional regulator